MTTDTTDYDFDLLIDTPDAWAPGDLITVLVGGATANFGVPGSGARTFARGDRIVVSRDTLRHQGALLDLVEDPAAQLRRWGQQRFQRGALDIERWAERGDATWILERDKARALANAQIDPTERAAAQREVQRRFGPGLPTSTSTEIRDVGQQRRIADDAAARAQQPAHRIMSTAE